MSSTPHRTDATRSESRISRLWPLLHWQLRFDSSRRELWLTAAGSIVACAVALTIAVITNRASNAPTPGKSFFEIMRRFLGYVTPLAALTSTSQMALDTAAGVLPLIRVSDLRASQWIAYRFLAIVVGFLPVWAVRLPSYALAFGLGGVTLHDLAAAEVIQWTAFIVVAAVGLLSGHSMVTAQSASQAAMFSLIGLELLFEAPRWLLTFAQSMFPAAMVRFDALEEITLVCSRFSLVRLIFHPPVDAATWTAAAVSIAIHLAAATLALVVLHRTLFTSVGMDRDSNVVPESRLHRVLRTARRRPRPWPNALAWQVYCFRHVGKRDVRLKTVLGLCVTAVVLGSISFDKPLGTSIAVITAAAVMIFVPAICGDAVQRELKDNTLSSLATLPLSGLQFYHGWLRGSRQLCIPEILWTNLCGAIVSFRMPQLIPLWLAVDAVVLLLPSLVFLAYLQTFVGFWESVKAGVPVMSMIGMALVSLYAALAIDPWIGLLTLVVLAVLARWVSLKLIPDAFIRRVESIS
jgi:hypothetical protein